jgi:hypothetical protein
MAEGERYVEIKMLVHTFIVHNQTCVFEGHVEVFWTRVTKRPAVLSVR